MAHSAGDPVRTAKTLRDIDPAEAMVSADRYALHYDGPQGLPSAVISQMRPLGSHEQAPHATALSFGNTCVMPDKRQLSHMGAKVHLGDRAYEALLALIHARGSVLSKDRLMECVWPGRIVEENTLEGQISLLRRALGSDRDAIRTVAGRGYQFVGELIEGHADTLEMQSAPVEFNLGTGLPASISRLIGREAALQEVGDLARSHRLITLVGAGGVGKTRLAIESARLLTQDFPDGVYLAELASTTSSDYLQTTVTLALGLPPSEATHSLEQLAPYLRDRSLLLLLDNCEHLIEHTAQFAEIFLRIAPLASIIATSREPLRVTGEYLYRVASLEVPVDESDTGARNFSAVQLLEERLGSETVDCLDPSVALALKVRICRRLDGIPLAVELAAACVPAIGLQGVAARLDDRFQLLTRGARGALQRQQTLRATLDWSYELLSETQSTVLNRLSVFPGAFALDSAQMVASCPQISPDAVVNAIIELVNKSLVSVLPENGHVRYRLLETTRAYAHDRLEANGMLRNASERHARYFLALFKNSGGHAAVCADIDWRSTYMPYLEDLRAAVAWGFSTEGDTQVAIDMVIASIPLSMQLALLEECLSRVDTALTALSILTPPTGERAMKLYAARGTCLLDQNAGTQTGTAFCTALELAEQIGDIEYQLRGLWGCWSHAHLNGFYEKALSFGRRFSDVSVHSVWPSDQLIAYRLRALARLCLGDLHEAHTDIAHVVQSRCRMPRAQRIRFLYDEWMMANTLLARTLWLLGRPDQAMRAALQALTDAEELGHPSSICYALSEAVCPMALLIGDDATLNNAIGALTHATRRHAVSRWKTRTDMWQALLDLRAGSTALYEKSIRPVLDKIDSARFFVALTPFLSAVGLLLGRSGEFNQALALIDPAIKRARETGDISSLVELLRAKAEITLLEGNTLATSDAEAMLRDALTQAQSRDFLAWELRCATSLATVWLRNGKTTAAHDLLTPIYRRYSEGFETRDLKAACQLLAKL